jgi:recombinational DNA repair ATPase RecF
MASCYRMSVPEFDRQMGLGLGGLTGGVGWLLLPAQSVQTLENLADLARLEPAALRAIEIPEAWARRRKQYLYCPRCVFLNPEDVGSPYWKRRWLDTAVAPCEVHAATPLRALPCARVQRCLNLAQLLSQVARYEREPQRESYESYQLAFNRLDIMSFHELQGVVDEDIDRG